MFICVNSYCIVALKPSYTLFVIIMNGKWNSHKSAIKYASAAKHI